MNYLIKLLTIFLTLNVIAACSSIPENLGRDEVDSILEERNLPVKETQDIDLNNLQTTLLANPLTINSATQLALISNPDIQNAYSRLGFAAADLYESERIRNPLFSFTNLDSDQSGEKNQITLSFIISLADIITLPSRKENGELRFAAEKKVIITEILNAINDVHNSYYRYVAAEQVALVANRIYQTASLSTQLANRYYQAGNFSARELAEEEATTSDAMLLHLNSNASAIKARAELANLLGLRINRDWTIESSFSDPLQNELDVESLVKNAQEVRLDLLAAKLDADRLANNLGVINWSRYIGELDVGVERERETDDAKLTGLTLDWEIPIFSQHNDSKYRAATELKLAISEVERLSNVIHNEVHLRFQETIIEKEKIIEYENNFIPSKSSIVQNAQKQENFMLIGTFELLATKRSEYQSYIGYLESLRDYWIAHNKLMHAAGNPLQLPNTDTKQISIERLIDSSSVNNMHKHMHH